MIILVDNMELFTNSFPHHYRLLCILSSYRYVATKITFKLLQNVTHIESGKIVLEAPSPSYKKGILSTAGKAKIRYVGGLCVAKTRKHISSMLKYHIGDPRQCIKARIAILEKQLEKQLGKQFNLLHSFELSMEERKNAPFGKKKVERRQNITQGLTYVNEKCFPYFCARTIKYQHS